MTSVQRNIEGGPLVLLVDLVDARLIDVVVLITEASPRKASKSWDVIGLVS